MDIMELRSALKRAASLFKATGAKTQAQSIVAVENLIGASGDKTVEEFVDKTRTALREPQLGSLTVLEVVERLVVVGTDQSKFTALYKQMQSRGFDKDKALEVAARFTGARKTTWTSKPKALQAIKSKFEERAYLASKDAANSGVTPW
jgi:hypothetical protein